MTWRGNPRGRMRGIPAAEDIEIVRAEDPVASPYPAGPLPDETLLADLVKEVAVSGRTYALMTAGLTRWDFDRHEYATTPLKTVGDVRRLTDAEFLRVVNIGRKTLKELREACGDKVPFKHQTRPTMREALGAEMAEMVTAMRSVASNLSRLADLIEAAGRKGKL